MPRNTRDCKCKHVSTSKEIKFSKNARGERFNSPGHSLSDLTIVILERVKSSDDLFIKERE
jgi:hypothetical protein